jgi:hypothetical protein
MADNVNYSNPTTGTLVPIGTDTCTVNAVPNVEVPLGKVGFGANEVWTYVTSTVGLPVAVVGTVPVTLAALPPLAAGTNVIGHVVVDTAPTTPVTGTFWPATQPVSGTVAVSNFPGTQAVSLASLPALATGTNVIGHVVVDTAPTTPVTGTFWQATQPASLASLPALAAGTNVIGVSISPNATDLVYNGSTGLTPKFAIITASASGATQIVALVVSKKIRVLKLTLSASAAVNVKFQSHVTPTDKTGLFYLAANSGFGMGFCPVGHFETVAGEALDINLSAAVPVGGVLTYVEV